MIETFTVRMSLGGSGPTIAIKDSIDIAGYPTLAGSFSLVGRPPATEHAEVVTRLLAAGWHIIGKTNMHELAFGVTGINDFEGTPINPQDAALVPGGSSSGSAVAVGTGEVEAALGTDTGGSIRVPAACCGIYGFKPTFGRVSRRGVEPECSSLDCVGPMARNMATIVRVMDAIDPRFQQEFERESASTAPAGKVRLISTHSDEEILEALDAVLNACGWDVERITLDGFEEAFSAGLTVINVETWSAFGDLLLWGKIGADVEKRLKLAGTVTAEALQDAQVVRRRFTKAVNDALEGVDAFVLPTMPSLPPTIEAVRKGAPVIAMTQLVRPFNLSGHPALTIPIPTSTGIKTGLQIVGRLNQDAALCLLGMEVEQAMQRCAQLQTLQ